MKTPRPRTIRRQRQRLEARELTDVRGRLAAQGVYRKCALANAVVAPGNELFWKIYKARVAAAEFLSPIRDAVKARDIAVSVLGELGVDTDGITLRATWRPATEEMVFEADPSYEVAMEAVEEERESERGKARAVKLAQVAACAR